MTDTTLCGIAVGMAGLSLTLQILAEQMRPREPEPAPTAELPPPPPPTELPGRKHLPVKTLRRLAYDHGVGTPEIRQKGRKAELIAVLQKAGVRVHV